MVGGVFEDGDGVCVGPFFLFDVVVCVDEGGVGWSVVAVIVLSVSECHLETFPGVFRAYPGTRSNIIKPIL